LIVYFILVPIILWAALLPSAILTSIFPQACRLPFPLRFITFENGKAVPSDQTDGALRARSDDCQEIAIKRQHIHNKRLL
jgi:hypothetical protein